MTTKTGELALISHIRNKWGGAHRRGAGVVLGIGDDCALLRPPANHEIALTTDLLLEGRHFRREWHSAQSVGHRALARGLSDLASMGAKPMAAFLSIALPHGMLKSSTGRRWVRSFFTGLRDLGERSGVALAGGDTAESPSDLIMADIVLTGAVRKGRALRRSAGKPGDLLYVTGTLGGSAAELESLARGVRVSSARKPPSALLPNPHPQLFPEPRVSVGLELVRRNLSRAAIDISDGVSTDLAHLCAESGTGAELDSSALPVHPLALRNKDREARMNWVLHGGEDYELVFTAPPKVRIPRQIAGVMVTRIGRLLATPGIRLREENSVVHPLKPGGWEHFT